MKKTVQHIALFTSTLLLSAQATWACGTEDYTGSICTVPYTFCPQGTMELRGQSLPINQNQALFSLIGTQFGGNGTTNFNLPDMSARTFIGLNGTTVNVGTTTGSATAALQIANIPAHTHTFTPSTDGGISIAASTAQGTSATPSAGALLAAANTTVVSPNEGNLTGTTNMWTNTPSSTVPLGGVTYTASKSATIGVTGSGNPFSIQPPSMGIRYCMVTNGIYPSRP